MSSFAYRRDIDGLRTVAVVPVVLNHAGVPGFGGGYVGVDVFFVISGFLISSILIREIEEGRYSIVGFYERRARRILPALFAVLAACLLAGWVLLPPNDYVRLARSSVATTLFAANLRYLHAALDYFAPSADFEPLLHTWSLAVEEQFYIVFPLLLAGVMRYARRWTVPVLVAITLGSLVMAVGSVPGHAALAFYSTPLRAWELGLGVLVSFAVLRLRPLPAPVAEAGAAAGLVTLCLVTVLYSDATPFPGLSALPPCLAAAALIWAGAARPTMTGRLLSTPPFVWIGLISYSLYLWHWPILVAARLRAGGHDLGPVTVVGAIGLAVLLAWASWRYVEGPFRRRGPGGWSRAGIFAASAAGMVAVGLAAVLIWQGRGLPSRVPDAARAV